METLKKTRDGAAIPKTNPFFFASKSSDEYLNTWLMVLMLITREISLQQDFATLQQYVKCLIRKKGNCNGWLITWATSSIFIETSIVSMNPAKVSRILMVVDSAEARKYKGKSLNEIALEDISFQSAEVGSDG